MEAEGPATSNPPLLYVVPPTVELQRACIDNTRRNTLAIIRNWLNSADPRSSKVLWLADISGSGKSAVARHVAWEATQNHQLLCSFFFRRDIEAQASTSRVIPYLARDLARQGAAIAVDIANAAKGLQGADYIQAFNAQITTPLCQHPPSTPCLILIDALDESGSPEARADFLSALVSEIPLLPPTVKVMLTSKPQQDIDDALNRLSAGDESEETDVYRLTFDVYGQENRRDLQTYVGHLFERVARLNRANGVLLPEIWPSLQQKKSLVAHANGLFLWVATAADYVACSTDPQRALEELLSLQNRPSPEAAIDALYKHILHIAEASPGFNLPTYHDAVELVLASPNPITVEEISDTLRRDAGPTLATLRPVMNDRPVVRIAHQSFREYVMDSQKCESRFFISRSTPKLGGQSSPLMFSPFQTRHDSFSSTFLATVATYPHAQHAAKDVSELIDPTSISSHPAARGAFGDVWRAKYRDGTEIAIKSLRLYGSVAAIGRHKLEKNSVRELVVWSKLNHPNVLSLLGICVFGGEIGMVAEWMPNGHVTEYSIKHPEVDKIKLISDIAAGLAYLHANGIVHGDLKGGNVVVSAEGSCKLVDFGLAKLTEDSLGVSTTSTQSGTTRWMPHELINPAEGTKAAINPSTDIYALGMTMLELLTGHPPFIELKNDLQVMFAVIRGDLPQRPPAEEAPQLSDRVWELMDWCWSRDPKIRPAADVVYEMVTALGKLEHESASSLTCVQSHNAGHTTGTSAGLSEEWFQSLHTTPCSEDLPPAPNHERGCIPGTRSYIPTAIHSWIGDPNSTKVLWLTDISGSGKSATARHVAWEATIQRQLLCSFFFRRDIEAQSNTSSVVCNMFQQLARLGDPIEPAIENARELHLIARSSESLAEAFHAAITVPLCLRPPEQPALILIDALDESGTSAARAEFLAALT
ncbi:hypothetical protein FRC07_001476 [Ceratobasidium sp. 392]|nr:hypothetical protein FRC07_001476 [Ceratobasidium sp. 392]